MTRTLLVLSLILLGCAGSEPTSSASSELEERPDEPGSTRASREAAQIRAAGGEDVAPPEPVPSLAQDRPPIAAHLVRAAEGEDGHGNTVEAPNAVAIDLDAHRFPPRALDPVLSIGQLRFTHYSHPHPGVLRFVVADRALLPEGAEVAVQYGDDASSRVVLTSSLEVTP